MKLLWGDLHNHCGITYGLGGLDNAFRLARAQLDFASVTPHAFWPDLPERNPDTAFIIDFHQAGFAKIAANWAAYQAAVEAANKAGEFTSFFSFEMHSARWGDHTFVSPDPGMRIAMAPSPSEVAAANLPHALIAIPHHIGYTPGYRGIDWAGFNPGISPLVEVCSKHGSAMHEYAGLPYYHDMGPLDSRNTVFAGLRQGRRFSFAANTDHHAGCPGSYGDGKTAVLAEANTRAALWEALLAGRTYAVTGCKIACDFSVNAAVFGSRIERGPARVAYAVRAGGALDRIIVYRGLEPVHIIDGLALPDTGDRFKVKVEFGWGANEKPFLWTIEVAVRNGELIGVEPCFRGRNMISPTQRLGGADDINDLKMSVSVEGGHKARLECDTVRNVSTLHPSTSAAIFELAGDGRTQLDFTFNGRRESASLDALLAGGFTGHLQPYSSNAYKVHTAVPSGRYVYAGAFTDAGGGDFYHMEVIQRDGDRAFVSPVFML